MVKKIRRNRKDIRWVDKIMPKRINHIFQKQIIQDSYACIEGKETHKAVNKMQIYLRKLR